MSEEALRAAGTTSSATAKRRALSSRTRCMGSSDRERDVSSPRGSASQHATETVRLRIGARASHSCCEGHRPRASVQRSMLELRPNCELCDKDLPPERRGRADLLVRVHVLQRVRRHSAPRRLPELRRRLPAASDPAASARGATGRVSPTTRRATGDGGARTAATRSTPSSSRSAHDSARGALARAGFQGEHARRGLANPSAERRVGPRDCQQVVVHGPIGAATGQEQEVRAGTNRALGHLARASPVERDARASSESVTTTPPKPSSPRRSPSMIGSDCDAMRIAVERRIARMPDHDEPDTPAATAARNGARSTRSSSARERGIRTTASSVFAAAPPMPGKCFAAASDAARAAIRGRRRARTRSRAPGRARTARDAIAAGRRSGRPRPERDSR